MILKVFFGGTVRELDLSHFNNEAITCLSQSYPDWDIIEYKNKETNHEES